MSKPAPRALAIGLSLSSGGGAGPWDEQTVAAAVTKELAEAKTVHNIDLETMLFDKADNDEETLAHVREYIVQHQQQTNQGGGEGGGAGGRPYDVFGVGFGVRGDRELTPLFEKIINLALELIPGPPKLAFPTLPSDVNASINRVWK